MGERDPQLVEVALEVTRRLGREECFGCLAAGARSLLGDGWTLAYAMSSDGEDLECVAAEGPERVEDLRQTLGVLDAGLVRHLAPGGSALLDHGADLAPEEAGPELPALGGALLVPLENSAGRVGLLLYLGRDGDVLPARSQTVGNALVREIVPALDNLRSVESLRELVIRDDTADCFNRRHLEQSLEDEVERVRRFGGEFSIIFIDMDNLKDVNTRHGHAAGSRVLYEASVRITRSIRSIDRLFRYGGDEFVVLLPGTGLDGGREVGERIRCELAESGFDVAPGARVVLTASFGVAAWPVHGTTGRQVIERADAAMRTVKQGGKNGLALAPSPAKRNEPGGGKTRA